MVDYEIKKDDKIELIAFDDIQVGDIIRNLDLKTDWKRVVKRIDNNTIQIENE